MKNFFNETRITCLLIFCLSLLLFLGACSNFPERIEDSRPGLTPFETNTGAFLMEDDCVQNTYLLKIENAPEQVNKLIISNFRNNRNVQIQADIEGSDIVISRQSVNLDGLIFNISGIGTKTGQKLDLFYKISNADQSKGYECQARGFKN